MKSLTKIKIIQSLIEVTCTDKEHLIAAIFGEPTYSTRNKFKMYLKGNLELPTQTEQKLFKELQLTKDGTTLSSTFTHCWCIPTLMHMQRVSFFLKILPYKTTIKHALLYNDTECFSIPYPNSAFDLLVLQVGNTRVTLKIPYSRIEEWLKVLNIAFSHNFYITEYTEDRFGNIHESPTVKNKLSTSLAPLARLYQIIRDTLLVHEVPYAALHTTIQAKSSVRNNSSDLKEKIVITFSSHESHPRPASLIVIVRSEDENSFATTKVSYISSKNLILIKGTTLTPANIKQLLTSPPHFHQSRFTSYSVITNSCREVGINWKIRPFSPTGVISSTNLNEPNA